MSLILFFSLMKFQTSMAAMKRTVASVLPEPDYYKPAYSLGVKPIIIHYNIVSSGKSEWYKELKAKKEARQTGGSDEVIQFHLGKAWEDDEPVHFYLGKAWDDDELLSGEPPESRASESRASRRYHYITRSEK